MYLQWLVLFRRNLHFYMYYKYTVIFEDHPGVVKFTEISSSIEKRYIYIKYTENHNLLKFPLEFFL